MRLMFLCMPPLGLRGIEANGEAQVINSYHPEDESLFIAGIDASQTNYFMKDAALCYSSSLTWLL